MITTLAVLYGCVAVIIFISALVWGGPYDDYDAHDVFECIIAALLLAVLWLLVIIVVISFVTYDKIRYG